MSKLSYTRAMITAVHEGRLESVFYIKHDVFGLLMPIECYGVPSTILNPAHTWNNKSDYQKTALNLAASFVKNFKTFESFASEEIRAGAPVLKSSLCL
ncbi:MAG: phosphoenolpyruvate carboxykinase (ATP) [Flavobacterium sp.]